MNEQLPKKIASTAELKERFRELLDDVEYTNFLLRMGNIPEIEPTASKLKELVRIAEQLHERGQRVEFNISHWDSRLVTQLEISDPRIERFFNQMRLKEELMKKHGDKLRKKMQGNTKLLQRPRRKRLPG